MQVQVVDLTESPRQDGLLEAVAVVHPEGDQAPNPLQQKLGPQAAAALQARAKRKLPDTFREPTKATHTNNKLQRVTKAPRPSPPVHRLPATRITAQAQSSDQATAHPLEKVSNDAVHPPEVLFNSANSGDAVVQPDDLEFSSSIAMKLATQAKRRMPESLAGPGNAVPKTRGVGTKPAPAALSFKAGPSDLDTKVRSCQGLGIHALHRPAPWSLAT
ncbi:hypothetical protein ABBQ38_009497 [Trebouxia sp. C0009 RCD-2024]